MIIRCLICIPVYNNPKTIQKVVQEILDHSKLPILVLDDGSDVPVENLVMPHPLVKIHRLEKNKGKGKAIQTCFDLAIKDGLSHILTIDGDGQHSAKDLLKLLEEIEKHPWDLIIGKRQFTGDHVPTSSQFGRKFSNFWVKYQTDQFIEDSQSGLRAYPLYFVQHMKFFTSRYDFEIEVLIRLLWKKVGIREIPVEVYYPPPNERISHFNKFWDNVKISVLNTILVILSLLFSNTSQRRLIASVFLGVFVGILPIFGFQIYFGMLFSALFRLNFPLMLIAQQISIPPLIPLWTYLSLKIGMAITNTPFTLSLENAFEQASKLVPSWIIGSCILGFLLALFFSFLTFIVVTCKKGQTRVWTGKDRGGKFGNWFMYKIISFLGPQTAYRFLYFICPYFYFFAPKAVYSHAQFFKISHPEWGFLKRHLAILKTFYKLGELLIDNFYSNLKKDPTYFNSLKEKFYNPTEALREGRGLILVGAHMGAWMYAAKTFTNDPKYPKDLKVHAVQYDAGHGSSVSDKVLNEKLQYLSKSQGPLIFKLNHALNQNEIVIFMADRLVDHNVELVSFFGKLAAIDAAPFRIALTKKAPLSFCYAFKRHSREYVFTIQRPIFFEEIAHLEKKQAILYLARKYTESMEFYLKKYPTQWFNFFPFWSSVTSATFETFAERNNNSQ